MKEIDFIPEWYKANQKRRQRYHRQYVLLAVLFAMMMSWSFVVGRHVERVNADVQDVQQLVQKGQSKIDEGVMLEVEIADLKARARVLEMTSPRTNISAMIAELSYLIRDNVILTKLSLKNEPIETGPKKKSAAAVVQIGTLNAKDSDIDKLLAQTRTKVTLIGIAAQPADAARLISQLEQSDYFEQETLVYSKPKKIREYDVTEFEIRCFVADYKLRQ